MRHSVANKKQKRSPAQKGVIQSASRAMHVFHHLVRTPEGKQLSELSRSIGLSEVTTFRLLQTLVYEALVRKDPERGRYRLTPLFWLTAVAAFPDVSEVQRQLRALLSGLATRTDACVILSVPYVGTRTMGTINVIAPEKVTLPSPPPANIPMHACAAGKCYLAQLSEDDLEMWLEEPLPTVTPHTCIDAEILRDEIHLVRTRGYALEQEEWMHGMWGIAVPVCDVTGAFIATLQLCASLHTQSNQTTRRWLAPLQSVAHSISVTFSALARLR